VVSGVRACVAAYRSSACRTPATTVLIHTCVWSWVCLISLYVPSFKRMLLDVCVASAVVACGVCHCCCPAAAPLAPVVYVCYYFAHLCMAQTCATARLQVPDIIDAILLACNIFFCDWTAAKTRSHCIYRRRNGATRSIDRNLRIVSRCSSRLSLLCRSDICSLLCCIMQHLRTCVCTLSSGVVPALSVCLGRGESVCAAAL
jgi:hypothetical protein